MALINEINKTTYDSFFGGGLYTKFILQWKITGDIEKCKNINKYVLLSADKVFGGINGMLGNNLSQYHNSNIEENTTSHITLSTMDVYVNYRGTYIETCTLDHNEIINKKITIQKNLLNLCKSGENPCLLK